MKTTITNMELRRTNTRRSLLPATFALLLSVGASAQVPQAPQVPTVVTTAFGKAFPSAMDVEWRVKGAQYKVEFETGLFFTDHEAWYSADGKLLRHEEEVSQSDLPEPIVSAAGREFPGYRVDDVERITVEGVVSYVVELKMKGQPEWKVAYDVTGKQLEKRQD
jgi:hypothetical protein